MPNWAAGGGTTRIAPALWKRRRDDVAGTARRDVVVDQLQHHAPARQAVRDGVVEGAVGEPEAELSACQSSASFRNGGGRTSMFSPGERQLRSSFATKNAGRDGCSCQIPCRRFGTSAATARAVRTIRSGREKAGEAAQRATIRQAASET